MMDLSFQQLLFYGFSSVLIMSALAVISSKNSVKAVLFLVLCFVAMAGLWMLLEAEFLAIALVLVYVGAVMVLFLFVVMMLDVDFAALKQGFNRRFGLLLVFAALVIWTLLKMIDLLPFEAESVPMPEPHSADYKNVSEIGAILYTDYVIAFELAAVILLVAMIAAISLTFRGKRERKSQDVAKQLKVSKSDRLKILKIDPVVVNQDAAKEGE